MKLLFCTALEPTQATGATIYTTRVLRALHALDLDITVLMIQFCSTDPPPSGQEWFPGLSELQEQDVTFHVYPTVPKFMPFAQAYATLGRNALYQIRDSSIFAFRLAYFQPLGMVLKSLRPSLTSLWFHDGIVEEIDFVHPDFKHLWYRRLFALFEKLGSRFVDWEFPVSQKMRAYSFNKGINGRRGSVVLPCIVELEQFYPRPMRCNENKGVVVVGFAGSLAPWQGFEDGCRLLQFLKEFMEIRLHVLTAETEKAQQIAAKYKLDVRVEWVRHEDVSRKMDQWDFALVPRKAGLITQVCSPLKATEALSKGVPLLICPAVGDFSEIVEKKGIGVVFDPEDIRSWPAVVDGLRHILDNYEDVSRQARALAEELYGWGILPQELSKVLRR